MAEQKSSEFISYAERVELLLTQFKQEQDRYSQQLLTAFIKNQTTEELLKSQISTIQTALNKLYDISLSDDDDKKVNELLAQIASATDVSTYKQLKDKIIEFYNFKYEPTLFMIQNSRGSLPSTKPKVPTKISVEIPKGIPIEKPKRKIYVVAVSKDLSPKTDVSPGEIFIHPTNMIYLVTMSTQKTKNPITANLKSAMTKLFEYLNTQTDINEVLILLPNTDSDTFKTYNGFKAVAKDTLSTLISEHNINKLKIKYIEQLPSDTTMSISSTSSAVPAVHVVIKPPVIPLTSPAVPVVKPPVPAVVSNVKEEVGDLFTIQRDHPDVCVFAHCIANDKALGKGIALEFARRYPGLRESLQEETDSKVGTVIIRSIGGNMYIANLITKPKSSVKPTSESIYLKNLESALNEMYATLENEAKTCKTVAMPRIGAGLDGMDWNKVLELIKRVTPMDFTVYIRTPAS